MKIKISELLRSTKHEENRAAFPYISILSSFRFCPPQIGKRFSEYSIKHILLNYGSIHKIFTVPLAYRHRTTCLPTPDYLPTDTGPLAYRHRTTCLRTPDHLPTDTGPLAYRHRTTCLPTPNHLARNCYRPITKTVTKINAGEPILCLST